MTTRTTPLAEYLISAGSGTTIADNQSSPLDLTASFSGGSGWTGSVPNVGITWVDAPSRAQVSINSTKITTNLHGAQTATIVAVDTYRGGSPGSGVFLGCGKTDFSVLGPYLGYSAANYQMWSTTAADGLQVTVINGTNRTSSTRRVVIGIWDSTLAGGGSGRSKLMVDGFVTSSTDSGITQNTTWSLNAASLLMGISDVFQGGDPKLDDNFYGSIYLPALSIAEGLALSVFLKIDDDNSPVTATGPLLLSASANGGSDDASTASTDHTVAPTVNVVSGSGNNRKVIAVVSYSGVTTGITTKTLGGVAFTSALDTGPDGSGRGIAILYMDDASIPGTGTQTASIIVDGGSGTVAATLYYFEGAAQGAPGNTVNTSGTGTSLTGTPGSNDAAGSVRVDGLFDATTTDTPASGSGQLTIAGGTSGKLNGTGTGNTHTLATSAKYNRTSASNPTSWSSLTNTSQKYLVSVEIQVAGSTPPATVTAQNIALFFGHFA